MEGEYTIEGEISAEISTESSSLLQGGEFDAASPEAGSDNISAEQAGTPVFAESPDANTMYEAFLNESLAADQQTLSSVRAELDGIVQASLNEESEVLPEVSHERWIELTRTMVMLLEQTTQLNDDMIRAEHGDWDTTETVSMTHEEKNNMPSHKRFQGTREVDPDMYEALVEARTHVDMAAYLLQTHLSGGIPEHWLMRQSLEGWAHALGYDLVEKQTDVSAQQSSNSDASSPTEITPPTIQRRSLIDLVAERAKRKKDE